MQHSFAPQRGQARFMVGAAFLALFVFNATAQPNPARPEPKDVDVIAGYGMDLPTLFAKFGQPFDLVAGRGSTQDFDQVVCDYQTFMFGFRDRKVVACFFRKIWKGTILGIKIGDTPEDVTKVLGKASEAYHDKNGALTGYGYPMKDRGITFYANFDPATGKVIRVEINALL